MHRRQVQQRSALVQRMELRLPANATLVGRVHRPGIGPCVVAVRDGVAADITSRAAPTVRDVCEQEAPADYVNSAPNETVGGIDDIARLSVEGDSETAVPRLLAPCDLQVIKACGVTFTGSMVERVIEERAAGDPARAEEIRNRIGARIGSRLGAVAPGSAQAAEIKDALIAEGMWSQYLEVGIGPDAEVFTKCPAMAAVGAGGRIGIHPRSVWNNPEPELVLAVNSKGRIVGVALGNDVNLRDFEGRSALLLGKSKDNNASTAIGPLIRLFDDGFTLDHARGVAIDMRVSGEDGFLLEDTCRMNEISRDVADLAAQTLNENHAYPDGFMLFCGTPFAPVADRSAPGAGFTHLIGDIVEIEAPEIGRLSNRVAHCADCLRWDYSVSHLMRNLAARSLI